MHPKKRSFRQQTKLENVVITINDLKLGSLISVITEYGVGKEVEGVITVFSQEGRDGLICHK